MLTKLESNDWSLILNEEAGSAKLDCSTLFYAYNYWFEFKQIVESSSIWKLNMNSEPCIYLDLKLICPLNF